MLRVLMFLLVAAIVATLLWWAFKPVVRVLFNQQRAVRVARERKRAALLRLEAAKTEAEAQKLENQSEQVLEDVFEAQMSRIEAERKKEQL